MDKKKYQIVLKDYLPEKAIDGVIKLLDKYPVHLIITKKRVTKHGDFKVLRNGQLQITVNHNLNKYSFLLTLIHELAHLTTYKKIKKNEHVEIVSIKGLTLFVQKTKSKNKSN